MPGQASELVQMTIALKEMITLQTEQLKHNHAMLESMNAALELNSAAAKAASEDLKKLLAAE